MNTCILKSLLIPSVGFGQVEVSYQINAVGSKEIYTYGKCWHLSYGKRLKELDPKALKRMNHLMDQLVMEAVYGKSPDAETPKPKKKPKPKVAQSTDVDPWDLPL